MKCPRCGLNNLEHVRLCVKCNLLLVAVSLPENFSPAPPRAGRWQFFRILYWKWRRSRNVFLPANEFDSNEPKWKRSLRQLHDSLDFSTGSISATAMNFLLPGYGQFLLGRRIRGAVFAITALISLVIAFFAIFNYYVDILRISVNVYLICMSIAVFDSMPKLQRSGIYDRFVNICLAGGVWLGCFFYVNSASTAISGFLWDGAELLTLGNNYNPDSVIQRGDTVIVRREQSYKRGSIIIFEHLQPYLYGGRLALREHMRGLDKIIGLPGEHITVKNGIVMVNGKILDGQKELMLFVGKIPDMQWMLSENEYFAVNSNMQPRLMNYMAQQRKSTVIEANAIKGRIVRIVSPVYRRRYL